jgi:hypothetical protein
MRENEVISAYQATIGRIGGKKSSPAKRASARAAALKRWGRGALPVLEVSDLNDATWYSGKGRNADMGLWDSKGRCFWVALMVDQMNPLTFPEPGARTVRLKRERHVAEGGTSQPQKPVS